MTKTFTIPFLSTKYHQDAPNKQEQAGTLARTWVEGKCTKVLVRKLENKKPLERSKCKCQENIKMDLTGTKCEEMNRIKVTPGGVQWQVVVNTTMNHRVP